MTEEEAWQDQENRLNAINGGKAEYYQVKNVNQPQDLIELRNMNFSQGNILKAAWCFNVGRHDGTSYERELNKVIWFAQRELNRIKKPS